MLVVTRKTEESVIIADNIEVTVLEVSRDRVKLGISAPKDIKIIRNELRHRYKWYTLKHKAEDGEASSEGYTSDVSADNSSEDMDMGFAISPAKVREAVYETILSIDGLAAAATDNASPFAFIKDTSAMPDEQAEIVEMSKLIKQAIAKLPQKERTVVEYRFYRNMQAKDIANMIGLSPSRITRIIQFSLNQIREYLKSRGREDY